MYGALFRLLPGPKWLRLTILVTAGIGIIIALMAFVYPWIDSFLQVPTIEDDIE